MLSVQQSHTAPDKQVSAATSSALQQFARAPLLYVSRWYRSALLTHQPAAAPPPSEQLQLLEEEPAYPRLHEKAEGYLSSLKAGTASIVQDNEEPVNFLQLPVGVHLQIFSYLDAKSLCRLGAACGYLNDLTSDSLLWRRLLERDVLEWGVVGHLSHPLVYQEASSDLTPKHIYQRCCSQRHALPPSSSSSFSHPLTSRLRSLVRRIQGHVPKLLLFGSGLETVPLVRTLLWEPASPYRPIGLSPGKDGIGSGVCIEHRSTPINLVALYTATRAERLAAVAQKEGGAEGVASPRVNKLVSSYSAEDDEGPELTQAVQELCQQADGFVLAIDSRRLETKADELDTAMLNAMLTSSPSRSPLLVLACRMTQAAASTLPPAVVAERLNLCQLTHPWQVRSVPIDTYQGLEAGFDWLLGAAALS